MPYIFYAGGKTGEILPGAFVNIITVTEASLKNRSLLEKISFVSKTARSISSKLAIALYRSG